MLDAVVCTCVCMCSVVYTRVLSLFVLEVRVTTIINNLIMIIIMVLFVGVAEPLPVAQSIHTFDIGRGQVLADIGMIIMNCSRLSDKKKGVF